MANTVRAEKRCQYVDDAGVDINTYSTTFRPLIDSLSDSVVTRQLTKSRDEQALTSDKATVSTVAFSQQPKTDMSFRHCHGSHVDGLAWPCEA